MPRAVGVALINDRIIVLSNVRFKLQAVSNNFTFHYNNNNNNNRRRSMQYIFQDFCFCFCFFGGIMDKLGYKISDRHDWS